MKNYTEICEEIDKMIENRNIRSIQLPLLLRLSNIYYDVLLENTEHPEYKGMLCIRENNMPESFIIIQSLDDEIARLTKNKGHFLGFLSKEDSQRLRYLRYWRFILFEHDTSLRGSSIRHLWIDEKYIP